MTVDDIRERIKKKDIELYVQELLQFENTFDDSKRRSNLWLSGLRSAG